ncbi:MAG: hypothetical protein EOP06_08910, partial [Proteobacteria bacterium]
MKITKTRWVGIRRHQKTFNTRMPKIGLQIFMVLLCLIVGHSKAFAIKFYSIPSALFSYDKSTSCSVVTIHSLATKEDGTVVHQQGVGSVVLVEHQAGIITPNHVIVNSQLVVGECRGKYFSLSSPVVDAERDIAFLEIDDLSLMKSSILTPLIVGVANEESAALQKILDPDVADEKSKLANPNLTWEMMNDMGSVMLSMSNFGVALPYEKNGRARFQSSPVLANIVQGYVETTQAFTHQLLRIDGLGIRPGISGAPLFGVPDTVLTRGIFFSGSDTARAKYNVPMELMPKFLLGMVVKTRLNGAETVALSLPDIYTFLLEKRFPKTLQQKRGIRVNYQTTEEAKSNRLQSYLTISGPDSELSVLEVCSDEYKNSADQK